MSLLVDLQTTGSSLRPASASAPVSTRSNDVEMDVDVNSADANCLVNNNDIVMKAVGPVSDVPDRSPTASTDNALPTNVPKNRNSLHYIDEKSSTVGSDRCAGNDDSNNSMDDCTTKGDSVYNTFPSSLSVGHFLDDEVTECREIVLVSLVDCTIQTSKKRTLLYRCNLCRYLFAGLDQLHDHLIIHNLSTLTPLSPNENTAMQCNDGGDPFTQQSPSVVKSNGQNCDDVEEPSSPQSAVKDLRNNDKNAAAVLQRTTSVRDVVKQHLDEKFSLAQMTSSSSLPPPSSEVAYMSKQQNNDIPDLQQAEDLSKSCQRRLRPPSSHRRPIESLQCRRPTQRLSVVTMEMLADEDQKLNKMSPPSVNGSESIAGGPTVVGETLANAIRQKEHLGDDVTVVIPSDAPIDVSSRHAVTARTEAPSAWISASANNNGVDDEPPGKQIAHSPVKSLMGHPHMQRKSRLSSGSSSSTAPAGSSQNVSSSLFSAADNSSPPAAAAAAAAAASSAGNGMPLTAGQMSLINAAAESLQFAGGLPAAMFGPLALSTFVNGFGGLVAATSPFLSYYTQMPTTAATLAAASLMSVNNPVGNGVMPVPPPVTPSQVTVAGDTSCDNKPVVDSSSDSCPGGANAENEEVSNSSGNGEWSSNGATVPGFSSPNAKCSSLSRTHSRLNVVRRPIKREDACRPVVLSDGRTAFRCIYCKKDFCTISDVNRHMDFHEDIRPYKCRFCNYYARTNSQLKVHMMRHQGIREYMCRLCNYKGVTQSDLNRHTKSQIHLMKARNECLQCSEGFVSPINLEQHRQDKHSLATSHSSTSGANDGARNGHVA